MKLVTFEEPVWLTLQGEGTLLGTPSVFIRTWGCDFSCSWCDTKDSWQPGSRWQDVKVTTLIDRVRAFRCYHAVITGGNPLLQVNELADLVVGLQQEWRDTEDGWNFRPGMHVTVETQASVYDETISRSVDLLSLSPKLHDWRQDVVDGYVEDTVIRSSRQTQIKVVCGTEAEALEAIEKILEIYRKAKRWAGPRNIGKSLHFILQPESSTGRKGVEVIRSTLERFLGETRAGYQYPTIRVIPQSHKGIGLYVR